MSSEVGPVEERNDPSERFYVWADLASTPIRAMSAYFFTGGGATEFSADEAIELTDVPDGRAWITASVADGDGTTQLSWSRAHGSFVIVNGSGVSDDQLSNWMFEVGLDDNDPPASPDFGLIAQSLDFARTAPRYDETWRLGDVEVNATAWPDGLATMLGIGWRVIEPATVDGIAGYRMRAGGDSPTQVVVWPLDGGYWAVVILSAGQRDRFDEIIDHLKMIPNEPPAPETTPFTVTQTSTTVPVVPDLTEPPVPVDDALRSRLVAAGVDVVSAPSDAVVLGDADLCGIEDAGVEGPLTGGVNEKARRCFLDRHLASAPAAFVELLAAIQGDPIVTVWRSNSDGTVSYFVDATRDKFGSGTWETLGCARLTTWFPGGRRPTTSVVLHL